MFRAKMVLASMIILLTASSVLEAQNNALMLEDFNTIIGDAYSVSIKGKTLIVDGFREGNRVKQDRVNLYDLDLGSLEFSEEEQAVIIRCHADYADCISSTLMRERNKKSYRKRLLFSIASTQSGLEVEEAFKNLIFTLRK